MTAPRVPRAASARRRRVAAWVVVLALVAFALASCAPGANPAVGTAAVEGEEAAGFWLGLWHGVIGPITFLVSLFNDDVNVYEVHNSGNWYDFGFLLGLSVVFGGTAGPRLRR